MKYKCEYFFLLRRLDIFAVPALLIKILTPPNVESTQENTFFTACSFVTSQTFVCTIPQLIPFPFSDSTNSYKK